MDRNSPTSTPRVLEAYWTGFSTWLLGRLDRRWFRCEVADRLRSAALDVGEAIATGRHRPGPPQDARLWEAVDRFGWLLDLAERRRTLGRSDLDRARASYEVVVALLARRPAATSDAEPPPPRSEPPDGAEAARPRGAASVYPENRRPTLIPEFGLP